MRRDRWAVEIAFVYLLARDEGVYFDSVIALDGDGIGLVVLDGNERAFLVFVAPPFVGAIDRFARNFVDKLCRSRLPVFLLICRNDTRSLEEVPG